MLFFKNKEEIYNYIIYLTYFLYIVIALGLSTSAPNYLKYLDSFIRLFVSVFLIIRFNPLRKVTDFNDFDRKIAFSAGVFTFTTTTVNQLLINYFHKFKSDIKKHVIKKN
jgi:hypothetical protein